jgi:hypothetical protein
MGNEHVLLSLGQMARRLKVAADALRKEAEAGRVPCVRVGDSLLFSPEAVTASLAERASRMETAT